MDITFKGRHTSVPERFRRHASGKLAKLEKLDQKAIRIDVEVSKERNPRQADRSERVELTVRSRGPAIRAEAAADDRYAALDLAFAKLEGRLRKAAERRKAKRSDMSVRSADALAAVAAAAPGAIDGTALMNEITEAPERARRRGSRKQHGRAKARGRAESVLALPETDDLPGVGGVNGREPHVSTDIASGGAKVGSAADDDESTGGETMVVPIQMEGEGPLVVREKFHAAEPMTIDQALLEMELVGHDFYAFHDKECGKFSVVYRRRGYDYGVIRLVEED
ncbi:MAG: ribosome-associated translation inhibitor RaiA [Streptosporangiales bacterium]|nr:ribosome-associated translation inhibitor RaiA [Streptosporangiales bacterium]